MSLRFGRNMLANVMGGLLPVAVSLLTVPAYLHAIGTERYGIVSICWILLGYFGFLDFGLSHSAANALSRLGHAGPAERTPVLATAFYLNLLLGLAAAALMAATGGLLLDAFHLPAELQNEARRAFPFVVPMLPLGMVLGVANGALESRERFLLVNTLQVATTVLGQVAPLVCAWVWGPDLTVVVPALLLARAAGVAACFTAAYVLERPVRPFGLHLGWARRLFGYGAWVSVTSLVAPMLETLDQMLIGRLLGPAALAHYTVPMNLALRSQVLATALCRTLFPRISRDDAATGRAVVARATVGLVYGFGAFCAPALVLAGPFLDLWVGPAFASTARPVAELLLLGAWVNGIAFLPFTQLQAQGRPDLTAKVLAAEVVPFIVGLWLLIRLDGLTGAALAWTLRTAVDCAVLLGLAGGLTRSMLRAAPGLAAMLLVYAYAALARPSPAQALAAALVAGAGFLAAGVWLEPAARSLLLGQLAGRLPRRRVRRV